MLIIIIVMMMALYQVYKLVIIITIMIETGVQGKSVPAGLVDRPRGSLHPEGLRWGCPSS